MNIDVLIKTCVELGSAKTLEALGISSDEISRNKAISVYGRYFVTAEKQGRINPVRIGKGRNGRKYYRVEDILSLKAHDALRAELK
jgi:hypothetical protein